MCYTYPMVSTPSEPDLERLSTWQAGLARQAEQLRAEIGVKQADLARVEERLALLTRLIEVETSGQPVASTSDGGDTRREPRAPSTGPLGTSTPGLEDAVEEILRTAGAPLHISEIREALVTQGVPIPGRGDDANIIIRLSRVEDRFTRTARGTYGLAEWGIPAVKSKRRKPARVAAR